MKILKVNKISKYYVIHGSKFEKLKNIFFDLKENKKFYAISDISFDLNKGEHLGIIGKNGSGKSTLLKILTGVTHPSNGSFDIKGKIFSILELGLGFNDNFSGRENIELSYSLYGVKKENLSDYIKDIIYFSELELFFERPLRTYSNGMRLRLAFAAAIFSKPDILIIDEALAVGDIDFQKKCFDKINELKKNGTTLIYVSHDINSVKSICTKAILLSEGKLIVLDNADYVCDIYLKKNFKNTNLIRNIKKNIEIESKENVSFEKCKIKRAFLSYDNIETDKFVSNQDIFINIQINFFQNVKPTVGFMIKNKFGLEIFGINSDHLNFDKSFYKNDDIIFKFKLKNYFAPGVYFLNCGIFEKDKNNFLQRNMNNLSFEVFSNRTVKSTKIEGFLDLPVELDCISGK
jgi:lipopolysaccharide transport system ATP-binding protein